jgi:cytochrome b561
VPMSRYHPLLVSLHWVLAFLIVAALTVGFFWLGSTPNSDPQKISVLRVHMAAGMLMLVLMGIRFFVRMRTLRPPAAMTGYPLLDRIAPITHYGFYVLVLLMVGTGYTTAIVAGLPAIVFGGSGDPLPPTFAVYPSWVAHGFIATLLVGFIALHVLAAFYHQFVRKTDCCGGCPSGDGCPIPPPRRNNSGSAQCPLSAAYSGCQSSSTSRNANQRASFPAKSMRAWAGLVEGSAR